MTDTLRTIPFKGRALVPVSIPLPWFKAETNPAVRAWNGKVHRWHRRPA